MSDPAKSIRFNVGGTVYDVSRSLLEQYPKTMLNAMASERWAAPESKTDNEDKDKDGDDASPPTLFLERNGERFQYVLDYMRDAGSVTLPLTIPKKGFVKDLEYYGFESVKEETILVDGGIASFVHECAHLQKICEKIQLRQQCENLVISIVENCIAGRGTLTFIVHEFDCEYEFARSLRRHGYHRNLFDIVAKQFGFKLGKTEYKMNRGRTETSLAITMETI